MNAANGVLANDTLHGATITAYDSTTTRGGAVGLMSDGSFTYTPPAGATGAPDDTFTYTVTNGGGTAQGTVTIALVGRVWFIDNTAAGPGSGLRTDPFSSIAAYNAATDLAGDIIYVMQGSGNYSGGVTLLNTQQLLGQPVNLATVLPARGMPRGEVDNLPSCMGCTNPVLAHSADVVTLPGAGGTSTIRSVSLSLSGGAAIAGNGAGTTTVQNVTISTSGLGGGVSLVSQSGVFTYTTGSIASGSAGAGTAVSVNGGSQAVSFSGVSVSQSGGRAVNIQNRTGGSVTFSDGSPVTLTGGTLEGLNLLSNGGATISFSDGVNISTSSAAGILATSSGTVNLGGTSNLVAASGGAALDVTSTNVGSGWTFSSVSSSGSSGTGISLSSVTGAVTMNGGAITGPAGTAFNVQSGSTNVTYAGSVAKTASGSLVSVTSRTGGTVTLSGNLTCTTNCGGISASSNSGGTIVFNGTTKTLNTGASAAVNLSNNGGATVSFANGGLVIDTTSGTGLSATGGGTINVTRDGGTSNTITATSGTAVSANGVTFGATFDSVTSSGGTNNLSLTSVAGTLTMQGGALSGASSTAVAIGTASASSGGTGNVTYAGTITKTSGTGETVNVRNKSAGTVTFSGTLCTSGTPCTGPVSLTSNSGATVTFQGGVNLSTGSSAAFTATGGGTVQVCDENPCGPGSAVVNTLTTTTGTALNVANTTIGASGLTFRSISANGAPRGIILDTTGSTGGLTVTVNGGSCTEATPTCTGGRIQNSTGGDDSSATPVGTGIVLNNTANVSLTRMRLDNHSNYASRGTSVNGFVFDNGILSTDISTVCLDIRANSVTNAGNESVGGADIRLQKGTQAGLSVRLPGLVGSTSVDADNWITANNPSATTVSVTGSGFSGGAACTQP